LEILAFPCNNFGGQEPGTNEEIQSFAISKGAKFPVLGKVECDNGDKTIPLYQFLKEAVPGGILGNGKIHFEHNYLISITITFYLYEYEYKRSEVELRQVLGE
jgi:glutathione peroxidase-family protein